VSKKKTDWPRAALALAARVPLSALHPAALAAAAGRPRDRWAVALSGGADSLALLLLLWAHFPEKRRRMTALHFNHRLRGRHSDADARFCRTTCRALGVPLVTGRWDKPPPNPAEAAARDARLAFIAEQQKKLRAPVLWQGHQRDDVLENLLLRLVRGSGAAGLSAPRPVQPVRDTLRLRPLLTLPKETLAAALREAGAPWREDATNATPCCLRNRLRHSVIPALRQAADGRDIAAAAALSRELLDEDNDALERQAAALLPRYPAREKIFPLPLRPLAGQPRAVLRRLLHRWLAATRQTPPLSRPAFESLLECVVSAVSTRRSLSDGVFALIRRGTLRLERRRP
jgi:tRNA(Ile)-lysidine synthase